MLEYELFQFGNQGRMPTESKVGVNASLDCGHPHLGEPGTVGLREQLVGNVDQCVAPPQPDGLVEQCTGESAVSLPHRLTASPGQAFELKDIDRRPFYAQHVATSSPLDGVGSAEHSAQRGDLSLQGVRAVRWIIAPQDLGEAVVGHHLTAAQRERCEQRGQPWPSDRDEAPEVIGDLE